MFHGFKSQDWKTINAISAENRLIANLLEPPDYVAQDGSVYRMKQFQQTDYGSTPPALWGPPLFLIPYGFWSLPTALHDAAYRNTLLLVQTDGTTQLADLSRAECDTLLCEAMASIKPTPTPFEKAQMEAIYEGVTLGGWHAYKEDRS